MYFFGITYILLVHKYKNYRNWNKKLFYKTDTSQTKDLGADYEARKVLRD